MWFLFFFSFVWKEIVTIVTTEDTSFVFYFMEVELNNLLSCGTHGEYSGAASPIGLDSKINVESRN